MEYKTAEELLEEQKELYRRYTAPEDRELIKLVASIIKKEVERKKKLKLRGEIKDDNS